MSSEDSNFIVDMLSAVIIVLSTVFGVLWFLVGLFVRRENNRVKNKTRKEYWKYQSAMRKEQM